jgi:hypothetical protein
MRQLWDTIPMVSHGLDTIGMVSHRQIQGCSSGRRATFLEWLQIAKLANLA